MAPLQPDALVLDMDGLMVDSEPLWHQVEQDVARAHGGVWTLELSRACVGTGLAHTAERMRDDLGLALPEDEAIDELVACFVERVSELRLKPGCGELLDAAVGRAPLALASSSTRKIIDAVLDRFDLRARFCVVVSGSSVPHPKPAPDIFVRAAERLGIPPTRCVALEDSFAGVTAARRAGMPVIAVPEVDPERFVGVADYVAVDLHEARRLIGW